VKFPSNTVIKLAAYAAALVVLFSAAFSLGRVVTPVAAEADGPHGSAAEDEHGVDENSMDEHGMDEHGMDEAGMDEHGMGGTTDSGAAAIPGLAVSEAGYTLVPQTTSLAAGSAVPFSFTVSDPDEAPLTSYVPTHEKDLHLIVVRRDMAGFQHVHPTLADDGTWSVALDLAAAGTYRVFADFAPDGLDRTLTLGVDITVAGDFTPVPLPAPDATSNLDGYVVSLDLNAAPGTESELTFTVSRGGQEVTDLEPYLGAFGHLVSLRVGDLAYLHTHPIESAEAGSQGGPAVEFGTEFPTAGTYRLFLDFQHDGAVHTAEFTVTIND